MSQMLGVAVPTNVLLAVAAQPVAVTVCEVTVLPFDV
jgi:hypothetical protein